MQEIKNFMLQKKDVNQDFNDEAIQTIKDVFKKNNLSTVPIISITVLKKNNLDFEDFLNSIQKLKGLYSINSSRLMRRAKLVFANFFYLLKFLCLNFYIEQSNNTQILNISFRKIQRKQDQHNQQLVQDKENNFQQVQQDIQKKIKKENKKYTGRFYLQIDKYCNFPLAKKVIGKQGRNMKDIIDNCKNFSNQQKFSKDFLKLRLRGKGSFHKEGSKRKECNDQLHLCVSAKDQIILKKATELIEKLLGRIYRDYMQFCRINNLNPPKRFYTKVFESSINQLQFIIQLIQQIQN